MWPRRFPPAAFGAGSPLIYGVLLPGRTIAIGIAPEQAAGQMALLKAGARKDEGTQRTERTKGTG